MFGFYVILASRTGLRNPARGRSLIPPNCFGGKPNKDRTILNFIGKFVNRF